MPTFAEQWPSWKRPKNIKPRGSSCLLRLLFTEEQKNCPQKKQKIYQTQNLHMRWINMLMKCSANYSANYLNWIQFACDILMFSALGSMATLPIPLSCPLGLKPYIFQKTKKLL